MDDKDTDIGFLNIEYDYLITNGTVIDPKSETRTIANVDPKTVKDNAAFPGLGEPMAAPDGIEYVFVNGVPVIKDGKLVHDARPGRKISSKAKLWRM